MRYYQIGLTAVGLLLGSAALLLAEEANVGELTRELTGEKSALVRTPEQLDAVYAKVVDALMPDLGNEDPGRRSGPQGTLERIAFHASRPGVEADRVACSKAIAAKLEAEVGPLGRMWLLRQLERIGRAEAVPQVAKLLTDQDPLICESARRALEKNPAREAGAALRTALAAADTPGWRVALINALAERREPSHLSLLIREAVSDVEEVRTAAVIGLAKLGDGSAAAVIAAARKQGTPRARRIATDCYLRLADALSARGNKAAALGIYREMLAAEGWLKCAALIGIGRTGSEVNLLLFFSAAADEDAQVRGACVDALCLLQGKNVRAAIVAELKRAKPQAKLALLQSLARLGERSALAVFMTAATDPGEAVQMAAIAGLGRVGDSTSVPLLLKAAAAAGKLQETARQSLQTLSGDEIDSALLDALEEKDPKTRVEAVRALSARHVVAATPALLKAAADVDASVRNESLKALGTVAPSDALPALAALLVKTEDEGIRNEAGNALVKIANRDPDIEQRSEPILQALGSSHGAARFLLLSVLGRIGGQKSLEGVRAAFKDTDEKVRDAAIRALCEWPDALAAEDLLAIAKSPAGETHQVLAIRGYIRVCSIRTDRPQAETAKMLATGLATAKRPEEKRQALGSLAEVRDILALKTVAPCMNDNALREEAASAAFRIGRDIWNDHPEAVKAAMRKVLEVSTNDGLKGEATEVLNHAEQKLREAGPKQ